MAITTGAITTAYCYDGVSTLSIARPSGVVNGDVLLTIISKQNTTAPSCSGWVTISTASTTPGTNLSSRAAYKIITDIDSEPASYVWTLSNNYRTSASTIVLSGVDLDNPIDASAAATVGINYASASHYASSIDIATEGALQVSCVFHSFYIAHLTEPYGTRWCSYRAATNYIYMASNFYTASVGATGNVYWSGIASSAAEWHMYNFAFKPAAESGGYANDVFGVASANIGKVFGVETANIDKVFGA